jgi:hypothetical protein
MTDMQRSGESDRPPFARFGPGRAALEAAILAEVEEAADGSDPKVLAAAVASAIEANNEELLRHLNEMLTSDTISAKAIRAKLGQPDVS